MNWIYTVLLAVVFALPSSLFAQSQSAQKIKATEEQIRQEMLSISKQLGVTCTECHTLKNFASPEKPNFKISLDHMKLVQMMKEQGFDGKKNPEASCYMCHRGQLKYKYNQDP